MPGKERISAALVVGADASGGFDGAAAAGLDTAGGGRDPAAVPATAKVLPLPSESGAMLLPSEY